MASSWTEKKFVRPGPLFIWCVYLSLVWVRFCGVRLSLWKKLFEAGGKHYDPRKAKEIIARCSVPSCCTCIIEKEFPLNIIEPFSRSELLFCLQLLCLPQSLGYCSKPLDEGWHPRVCEDSRSPKLGNSDWQWLVEIFKFFGRKNWGWGWLEGELGVCSGRTCAASCWPHSNYSILGLLVGGSSFSSN